MTGVKGREWGNDTWSTAPGRNCTRNDRTAATKMCQTIIDMSAHVYEKQTVIIMCTPVYENQTNCYLRPCRTRL